MRGESLFLEQELKKLTNYHCKTFAKILKSQLQLSKTEYFINEEFSLFGDLEEGHLLVMKKKKKKPTDFTVRLA